MLKFNNSHIFTGYIKQLLASVNLPLCKIYTKEDQRYLANNKKEHPEIVLGMHLAECKDTKPVFPYVPYIKDGDIMRYVGNESGDSITNLHWESLCNYAPESAKLNYTQQFKIKNNIYDSYTHEYLGDYLRFLRDYHELNLMPLYNCFNNKICNNILIETDVEITSDKKEKILFNSEDAQYKIYMFPVKLNKEYTIAIDCATEVEICCTLYGKYYAAKKIISSGEALEKFTKSTYKKYGATKFNQPFIYSELTKKPCNATEKSKLLDRTIIANESDLKMLIKVPVKNKSSIVVLEGNYVDYTSSWTKFNVSTTAGITVNQNHTVTNFNDDAEGGTGKIITPLKYFEQRNFKPISSLQLLQINTGISYPFADKLIEYLIGNAITHLDDVSDDIKRVQTVVEAATKDGIKIKNYDDTPSGIWDPRIQPIIYNFIMQDDKHYTLHADTLGYIDKTAEKYYSAEIDGAKVSISNVDIYEDLYRDLKQKELASVKENSNRLAAKLK